MRSSHRVWGGVWSKHAVLSAAGEKAGVYLVGSIVAQLMGHVALVGGAHPSCVNHGMTMKVRTGWRSLPEDFCCGNFAFALHLTVIDPTPLLPWQPSEHRRWSKRRWQCGFIDWPVPLIRQESRRLSSHSLIVPFFFFFLLTSHPAPESRWQLFSCNLSAFLSSPHEACKWVIYSLWWQECSKYLPKLQSFVALGHDSLPSRFSVN